MSRAIGINILGIGNYPNIAWNHVSREIMKFLYYLFVNNNKYLPHVVTISYSESAYPITPVELLKQASTIILEFQYILFTI